MYLITFTVLKKTEILIFIKYIHLFSLSAIVNRKRYNYRQLCLTGSWRFNLEQRSNIESNKKF